MSRKTSSQHSQRIQREAWKFDHSHRAVYQGTSGRRQNNLKACASMRSAGDIDVTAMLLDNLTRNWQSETCSTRFGREKRIEQFSDIFGRNPNAVILNADFQL